MRLEIIFWASSKLPLCQEHSNNIYYYYYLYVEPFKII